MKLVRLKVLFSLFLLPALIPAGGCSDSDQLRSQISKLENQIAAEEAAVRNLTTSFRDLASEFEQFKAKISTVERAVADLQKQNRQFSTDRSDLETEIFSLTGNMDNISQQFQKFEDEFSALLVTLQTENAEQDLRLNGLQEDLDERIGALPAVGKKLEGENAEPRPAVEEMLENLNDAPAP